MVMIRDRSHSGRKIAARGSWAVLGAQAKFYLWMFVTTIAAAGCWAVCSMLVFAGDARITMDCCEKKHVSLPVM